MKTGRASSNWKSCLILTALGLFLPGCVSRAPSTVPDPGGDERVRQLDAESLVRKGSFVSLNQAREIYQEIRSAASPGEACREELFRTLLLLAMRAKEMGILGNPFLSQAADLIREAPGSDEEKYLNVVRIMPANLPGIFGRTSAEEDSQLESLFDWAKQNAGTLNTELRELAPTHPFFAYLFLVFYENFRYWIGDEPDAGNRGELYPDTPLILYKKAQFPALDEEAFFDLRQGDPDFHEIDFFLGELALVDGKLVTAERYFKRACERFPTSALVLFGLSRVLFTLEEFSPCLDLYDRILDLYPEYREALLWRVVCLSYLDRHEEAMDGCRKLQDLGFYYLGESHYWMAWNLQQQERFEEARRSIEEAKRYLIGSYEVLLLSGLVENALGRTAEAESEFREVLKLSAGDVEANFHLGKIQAGRGLWQESARFFASAAAGCELEKEAVENRMREIAEADFAEDRRQRLMRRRALHLNRIEVKMATSHYNAAAGFANSGMIEEAREAAEMASRHPSFQKLADDLLRQLRK